MRIGVYGGTFSPVHNGHIKAAEHFMNELALDRLLVIPTFLPPHKHEVLGANCAERLDMLRLAFENDPRICVSDIEILRGGKSYTVDTLEELRKQKNGDYYLLCGTDMFLTLETWKDPRRIFELAVIVLGRRESDADNDAPIAEQKHFLESEYGAHIVEFAFEPIKVSSSELREKLAKGISISGEVPEKVEKYILKHRLYRTNAV